MTGDSRRFNNSTNSQEQCERLDEMARENTIFSLVSKEDFEAQGPSIYLSGEGMHITDQKGRRYLEMLSSTTRSNSLGYGSEEIAQVMYDQAIKMQYSGTGLYLSEPQVALAAKLAELAPGDLSKTCLVSGGSEATETSIKLARQYQHQSGNKPRAYKVISRWNAYHGSTMGALSVTDWLEVREIEAPRVPGVSFVANPMRYRNPFNMDEEAYSEHCAQHLERQILHEGPDQVMAFIGEPIMQANGVQVPSKKYWKTVREICDHYGVLLIMDEVITGFGRTGHWFAAEYFGIEPDILNMAKSMGGGFAPIGAVMTTPEIAETMPLFRHVHTFGGHAICSAVANKVIEIKERDGLIDNAKNLGEQFGADLKAALGDHPIVGDVRGLGFWHAIDFTSDKSTKAVFEDDTVRAVVQRIRDHGVIVGPIGTSLEIAPPLIAAKEQLDECVRACAQSIDEIAKERSLV